jgi:hypothetical protein
VSSVAGSTMRWQDRISPGGGGSSGGAGVCVANIAALVALDDTLFDDAVEVEVQSLLTPWMLVRASTEAIDGITVVATFTGVGRWHRKETPHAYFSYQTSWTIEQALGNDENDGSGGAPLATWDEWIRRVGQWLGYGSTFYNVYFIGNYVGNVDLLCTRQNARTIVTLRGMRTVLYSGTVGAGSVVWNAVTSTVGTIVDAAIPVSWTASGLVGMLFEMTSGPLSGWIGAVCKDLGAKTCSFQKPFDTGAYIQGDPAIGDSFDVYSVSTITGTMSIQGQLTVYLYDLGFVGPLPASGWQDLLSCWEGANVIPVGCTFDNGQVVTVGNAYLDLTACYVYSTCDRIWARTGGTLILDGCAAECLLMSERDASLQLYESCTTWNKAALHRAGTGNIVLQSGSDWGVFDLPALSLGLDVFNDQIAQLIGLFWGIGNLGDYGLVAHSSGKILIVPGALPKFGPNAVSDALVGDIAVTYAGLPVNDLTHQAAIVDFV